MTCSVDGCSNKVKGRGFCERHLWRFRKHGDPCGGGVDEGVPLKWLEEHVSYKGEPCLIWPFGRVGRASGYGVVYWRGRPHGAHRVMLCLSEGAPPTPSHQAAHSCGRGSSACVNPRHLRWATRLENMRDRIEHGTSNRGETNAHARLSQVQAVEIKRRLLFGESAANLAKEFGISPGAIRNIKCGRSWAWLNVEAA